MHSTPSAGARISAELDRDTTPHASPVEYVGGPRCGDVELIAHRGLAPPRTLYGEYHRIGNRTCAGGGHRYDHRPPRTRGPRPE